MFESIKKQLSHDASPFVQFIKYATVGGIATGTHILVFFLMGWFLFPCLSQDDIVVKMLHLTAPVAADPDAPVRFLGLFPMIRRALFALYCSTIGFVISNLLCYLLNRLFVFKPGRHRWQVELFLFFAASGISLVIGSTIQTYCITRFGIQTTIAFVANIVSAFLINYAARKFFIFNG
ncbi:MAG: GtrA family protein [Kiritimatiellae bacterium]|nr:GtrA family protein [Kiritimatiellia bacterium]